MKLLGALLLLLPADWDFGGGSSWDFSSPTWAFSEPEEEERPPVKVTVGGDDFEPESVWLWKRPRVGQILEFPSGRLWRLMPGLKFRRVLDRNSIGKVATPPPDGIVWFYTADW